MPSLSTALRLFGSRLTPLRLQAAVRCDWSCRQGTAGRHVASRGDQGSCHRAGSTGPMLCSMHLSKVKLSGNAGNTRVFANVGSSTGKPAEREGFCRTGAQGGWQLEAGKKRGVWCAHGALCIHLAVATACCERRACRHGGKGDRTNSCEHSQTGDPHDSTNTVRSLLSLGSAVQPSYQLQLRCCHHRCSSPAAQPCACVDSVIRQISRQRILFICRPQYRQPAGPC